MKIASAFFMTSIIVHQTKFYSYLVLLVSLVLFLGCDSRPISKDPLDRGIQKIDQRKYDEAIVYLQELSTKDSRPEVKLALASAYVGRSGVQFADYWEIVKILQTQPVTDETIQQSSTYVDNRERIEPIEFLLPGKVRNDIDELFQMVSAFRLYLDRVEKLPYVPRQKRSDLQTGISLLDDSSHAGSRFFRAVLVVTLLRSDLDDGFDVWDSIESQLQRALSNPLEAHQVFCTPVTGDFTEWLLEKFNYAESASADLQYAFPSDAEDFKSFSEEVLRLQDEIPSIQATLIPRGCP